MKITIKQNGQEVETIEADDLADEKVVKSFAKVLKNIVEELKIKKEKLNGRL